MKGRPILFSAPMVRAIREGRKTQTRRILKGSTEFKGPYNPAYLEAHRNSDGWASICPYGAPGDVLRVVELREIPGHVGKYLAGSDGRVYSATTYHASRKSDEPRPLKASCGSTGYPSVTLLGPQRGSKAVHSLVCAAFHGAPPSRTSVVRHLDGNKENNDPANLRWGTKGENEADKRRHRTLACGSRQGSAKLTEEAVDLIRRTVPIGLLTAERAAEFYGVVPSTIRSIVSERKWTGLGDAPALPPPAYEHLALRVGAVSVQKLQDISEEDARAEGVTPLPHLPTDPRLMPHRAAFYALWESINGADSWDANPYVWAISFSLLEDRTAGGGA